MQTLDLLQFKYKLLDKVQATNINLMDAKGLELTAALVDGCMA